MIWATQHQPSDASRRVEAALAARVGTRQPEAICTYALLSHDPRRRPAALEGLT